MTRWRSLVVVTNEAFRNIKFGTETDIFRTWYKLNE